MEKELFDEMTAAIKEDSIFDFVANNSWKMSQYDLQKVALELAYSYATNSKYCNIFDRAELKNSLIEYLEERLDPEDAVSIVDAVKEERVFDYIANNAFSVSKSTLEQITLELAYSYTQALRYFDAKIDNNIKNELIEYLTDRLDMNEDYGLDTLETKKEESKSQPEKIEVESSLHKKATFSK